MSGTIASTRTSLLTPQWAIMCIFMLQSLTNGGVFTRIPDLQAGLGLSEGALGLALMGQPLGALVTHIFASRFVERLGTQPILLIGIPVLATSGLVMALAPNVYILALAFLLFGCSFAFTNVTMNVEADRVEAATNTRVMNRCHGLWSIGFLVASLLGTLAQGIGLPTVWHLGLVIPIAVTGVLVLVLPMQKFPARAFAGVIKKRIFAVPTLLTLALVGFGIGGVLMEGGVRTWSVIFMRDSFDAPAWVDTLTLPAFLLTMSLGRFLADGWIEKFGPVRVAAMLIGLATAGLLVVVFSQNLYMAIAGFGLIGFGVCVSFPMTLSAAARLGDRPSSENVAAVTMVTTFSMLMAPGVLGWVAEMHGIRAAFAIMLPFLMLAIFLSRFLAPRTAPATDSDQSPSAS